MPKNLIIDPENDTDYFTEVRTLLGVTDADLTDAVLKSDVVLGATERAVCGSYVDNWVDILNGGDPIKAAALRTCIIVRVALDIIDSPAVQNILIDRIPLVDTIIESKKVPIQEVKAGLTRLFERQLAQAGVVHDGGWPEYTGIAVTDPPGIYDYVVDTNGGWV